MRRSILWASSLALTACAGSLPRPKHVRVEDLIRDPALETYIATRGHRLGQPASVQLTPDGRTALFLRSGPRSDVRELRLLDLATGADRSLATAESLLGGGEAHFSREEAAQRERMRVTARGISSFELSHDGRFALVPLGGQIFRVEVAGGQAQALPIGIGGAFDPQLSPDDALVAFVRGREVWIANADGTGVARQLTHGATATLSHGTAEFVAQEEMGRFHGTFWSPDSKSLAVQETDESGVEPFYLADPAHGEQAPESSPYPRPGHPNAVVRLGVVSIRGGSPTWIQWDRERYPYLARVHWKSGPLVIEVESRRQRDLIVLRADPIRGTATPLLSEHDDAWLELTDDFHELATGKFLWSSERSGQRNLELHRADGALDKVLTSDAVGFRSLVGVDEGAQVALIAAGTDATTQVVEAVPLTGGEPRTIAAGDGPANAQASRDGRFLWLRQDHLSAMPDQAILRSDGTPVARLSSAMEPMPQLPRPRFLTLDLPQGRLNAAVLLPSWARPGQRFPVIDWVYGGPTVTTVVRSAASFELQQWFADRGFAVVKIDNRGTPHRGRAFARAISGAPGGASGGGSGGSFAEVPLTDQADGLAALAAQEPALDLTRVGIIGASFGGYLSALAVLRRPDRFEAGVALAPVTDWLEYDTMYTERYLGLPSENPDGYARSSLLGYAKALRRPLLLGHGTADDNVHFGHTLELIAALEQTGHAPAVFLVPGQTHLFADQTTQEVLWANAAAFLVEQLGAGGAAR